MKSTDSLARKKAELQSRGVRIPEELIAELEAEYNVPAIKTGRMVLCLDSTAGNGELVPAFIVNGKRAATSPFHLAKNGHDGYEVRFNGKKYTDVAFLRRPRFYDKSNGNGIPANKLAVIVGPGHLRSVVNQNCYYSAIGKSCKFCAVQHWWDANTEKNAPAIAAAVEAGVREGLVRHVSLTTATLDTPGKGLEYLVETARLIHDKVDVPLMLEFEPVSDFYLLGVLLKEARQAGVATVSCNIECFDECLRPEIMPAKGRIPIADYVRTWLKCLEIFGENEVFTVAIAGIGEPDESLIFGVEMAASLGVMTFLVPHSPAIGAAYEDMVAPAADRMLSLYTQAVEIFKKYGLDIRASRAGCVRGGGFSAIKDVARFGI